MSLLARRDLLAALVALAAAPTQARATPLNGFADLDPAAVERIGRAWLALNPRINAPALARRLFPGGRGPDTLPSLRQRVAEDFRASAVFVHRGWRLSAVGNRRRAFRVADPRNLNVENKMASRPVMRRHFPK